jgi:cell wall-associated NlpC family hydrolase
MTAPMTPDRFAAAAAALLGAPFRLGGRDPEIGVDCVGLVACALGTPVSAPVGYALRNTCIARHLAFAESAGLVPATGPLARGDVILAVPGPAQHHVLVMLGPNRFVHAHVGLRRVALHHGPLPWPALARWRLASESN